jgi:outer membrane protein OmpA-like peptidoglycan-associated protein
MNNLQSNAITPTDSIEFLVKGPGRTPADSLWEAKVQVLRTEDPERSWPFRELFVSRQSPLRTNGRPVLPPGVVLASCRVLRATLRLDQPYVWNDNGASLAKPSLLLLQALPEEWESDAGALRFKSNMGFTCLAGQIPLSALAPPSADWRAQFPNLQNHDQLSLHSSGISLRGHALLPWEDAPLPPAFYHAIPTFDRQEPASQPRVLRMALDRERLPVGGVEARKFEEAFQRLAGALLPDDFQRRPRWVSLELTSSSGAPGFYWELRPQAGAAAQSFRLEREELHLLLADQPLGDERTDPRSLCRTLPETVEIVRRSDQELIVRLESAPPDLSFAFTPQSTDPAQAPLNLRDRLVIDKPKGSLKWLSNDLTRGEKLELEAFMQTTALSQSLQQALKSLFEALTGSPHYHYEAQRQERQPVSWDEKAQLVNLTTTYDPLDTALQLRQQQSVPTPDLLLEKESPALLWGFTPLADGWAQLPFLNLTEQLYLDVFNPKEEVRAADPRLFGAFVIGNDLTGLPAERSGEQRWSVTLLDAARYGGTWALTRPSTTEAWRISEVSLWFREPEVVLNGFFWLATEASTAADALPSLDNWLGGLRMVSLQTPSPETVFPAPFVCQLEELNFSNDLSQPSFPKLGIWKYRYRANQSVYQGQADNPVFETLITKGKWNPELQASALWVDQPLVWRRHPYLPAIQALPLTQNQEPPNYPSPSRQLAPFQLPVDEPTTLPAPLPREWRFGVTAAAGATTWPRLLSAADPVTSWAQADYLWLASLSVPGLVFDAARDRAPLASTTGFLPAGYLFSLPFTAELNALAQLPKETEETASPDPREAAPEPVVALRRADYAPYWSVLAERAFLAQPDRDEALARDPQTARIYVQGLAEPYEWDVAGTLNETSYPGGLTLVGDGLPLILGQDLDDPKNKTSPDGGALRGLHGFFTDTDAQPKRLKRVGSAAEAKYVIEAGSLAATGGDGQLRDQRGLRRRATAPAIQTPTAPRARLLKTEVQLEEPTTAPIWQLCSLLEALELFIEAGGSDQSWGLWFRDAPVAGQLFDRKATHLIAESRLHRRGVNDPAATARELAHLTGYEWRLAESQQPDGDVGAESDPLKLLAFDFYPLSLDQLKIVGDQVETVWLTGRLQLPAAKPREQADLNNAAQLQFELLQGRLSLKKITAAETEPDDGRAGQPLPIEWPLSEEAAASLFWNDIHYDPATGRIDLIGAQLEFSLFDARWKTPPKDFSLPDPLRYTGAELIPASGALTDLPNPPLLIHYDTNSDTVTGEGDLLLQRIAQVLRERPELPLCIEGHTDDTGNEAQNQNLSERRAEAVKRKLVEQFQIAARRISTAGFGSTRPLAPNDTAAGQRANRRAEILLHSAAAITVEEIRLDLALDQPDQRALTIKLAFQWDGVEQLGLKATVTANLFGPTTGASDFKATLKHGAQELEFGDCDGSFTLANRAVQLSFNRLNLTEQKKRQLLPGMHLSEKESAYGFAVLLFDAISTASTPALGLRSGYLELILPCEWGRQLQERTPGEAPEMERVFGSSAGYLYGGYTLNWAACKWTSALLLNGFLEVKNLISWPAPDLAILPKEARLIHFDTDDDDVENKYRQVLRPIARVLLAQREASLRVEGHTDNTGTERGNEDLARRRAAAVKEKLVEEFQIPANRISTAGFGSTQPLVSNDTEVGRRYNRRAELILESAPAASVNAATFTLPAARHRFPDLRPALHHWRHTARLLFNQHEVPQGLLVAGEDNLLFTFREPQKNAWQLLAVVEHQLLEARVNDPKEPSLQVKELKNERRWTAVQEVRLFAPAKFVELMKELRDGEYQTLDPRERFRLKPLIRTNRGYQREELIALLLGDSGLEKLRETLLVDASAPHWLRVDGDLQGQFTNLQYLARGAQRALLSAPEDFASRAETAQPWLLLALPFLGRLQARRGDELSPPDALGADDSYLRFDPIILLDHLRRKLPLTTPLPGLPLGFASWEDTQTHTYQLAEFDLAAQRRWDRLDPATLAESWFRIQNPPLEATSTATVPSVLASLPTDSPGRLSRAALLTQLFESTRYAWPPRARRDEDPPLEEVALDRELVWRRQHLFVIQGVSKWTGSEVEGGPGSEQFRYGFYFTGAQLYTSPLAAAGAELTRHSSATMFPASLRLDQFENRMPVSFAVSPYLGLEFQRLEPESNAKPLLAVAELLCLNPERAGLSFVTSQIWEERPGQPEQGTLENLKLWGREAHSRLAADSPIAMLRVRSVKTAAAQAGVVIEYSFIALDAQPPIKLARRTRRMRIAPEGLRFAEGQFGGTRLPKTVEPLAQLFNFEVAPPQMRGVQPLYLDQRPAERSGASAVSPPTWPWGMSALRFSVRHLQGEAGTVGQIPETARDRVRLWWQALAHEVQFALTDRAGARRLLPKLFRARAIRSLLPAAPQQPGQWPAGAELQLLGENGAAALDKKLLAWQPLLPGAFRYLLLGARAGAPFIFRHQLICQETTPDGKTTDNTVFASGAAPVQHRMPRPVSLPPNQETATGKETALRAWASYYAPTKSLQSDDSPSDNAFLGAATQLTEAVLATLTLKEPGGGVITPDSNGVLRFQVEAHLPTDPRPWEFTAEMVIGERRFPYQALQQKPPGNGDLSFSLAENGGDQLQQLLGSLPHGAPALVKVGVSVPYSEITGYRQQLSFPLRLERAERPPLPLQPRFIQFEDPEYNRRLASMTSRQTRPYPDRTSAGNSYEITLAADRREYNPTSQLFITCFGKLPETVQSGQLELTLLNTNGQKRTAAQRALKLKELAGYELGGLTPQAQLGDVLLVSLTMPGLEQALSLRLDIVAKPVLPTPEAGYALLRRAESAEGLVVECARFAWAPAASRIELVNPDDLQQEIVRRRAVFHWLDAVRPITSPKHEIQKITFSGSTYIPRFED